MWLTGLKLLKDVVNAWVKSDAHRKAMEGEATHFGISVKRDTKGKNYFTIYLCQSNLF